MRWHDAGCARKHGSTKKFHFMRDGREEQSRAECDGATMSSLDFRTCWCVTTAWVCSGKAIGLLHPMKEFAGYSPYLGDMTHDVYPGIKNLITAGHSYEAQNCSLVPMMSIHRIHQNIYLCGAQQRDILDREPVVPHSHSHSVSVSRSACRAERSTLAGHAFIKTSCVV